MTLKGVAQIDEILNDFLEPFDCTARLGTDFCYVIRKSLIIYALVTAETSSADFLASVEALDPAVSADIFLWSFLHELGHHETLADLSDKQYAKSLEMKEKGDYYNAPDERAATAWAVEYAETHVEELKDLWQKLQPAIMNFYKLNEVED